jgi:hypothetical protein
MVETFITLKIKMLMWLVMHNEILTKGNLFKKGMGFTLNNVL